MSTSKINAAINKTFSSFSEEKKERASEREEMIENTFSNIDWAEDMLVAFKEFGYNGADINMTRKKIYELVKDGAADASDNRKAFRYVFLWLIKNGGAMNDKRFNKYTLAAIMKAAVAQLKIKSKQDNITSEDLTPGRISAAMHVQIIALMLQYANDLSPAAGVKFAPLAGLDTGAYIVFCSTYAPYCYIATADTTNKVVKKTMLEWSFKHHNTVNPIKKQTGLMAETKRAPFNMTIFDIKIDTSMQTIEFRTKWTQTIAVLLATYVPGTTYPSDWKEHSAMISA